jgi:nucleoside-diphosphate-sugar epimerase
METKSMRDPYVINNGRHTDGLEREAFVIGQDELILVTGATGFIGSRLIASLLDRGFCNLRCLVRPSSDVAKLEYVASRSGTRGNIAIARGNLLSGADCTSVTKDVAVIFHLAASRNQSSFPEAYLNSVVTTRNLLDASVQHKCLKRFVNLSSFAVYTNTKKPRGRLLDESCPVATQSELRTDAYCFTKAAQDEIVTEYGKKYGIPYVTVRPGYVYGPGKQAITARVGIDTFGVFLHLGGSNPIPFTYVDNCAEAIALAGLRKGVDGEVFNVVDDDLPTSRQFLRSYKKNVNHFKSIYVPHVLSYAACYLWERYSTWSEGQLPPAFTLRRWHANWKKTHYSNDKLKARVGWTPKVSTAEGFRRYFEACPAGGPLA